MDPNANLAEQAAILAMPKRHNYDRYRLYDLRVALRDWLRAGGFSPTNTAKHVEAWSKFEQWQACYTTSK